MNNNRVSRILFLLLVLVAFSGLMAADTIETLSITKLQSKFLNNDLSNIECNLSADPNPFDYFTIITTEVAESVSGTITIKDRYGSVVKDLYSGFFKQGDNRVVWYGDDNEGISLSPGSYQCELVLGGRYTSRTIILILK